MKTYFLLSGLLGLCLFYACDLARVDAIVATPPTVDFSYGSNNDGFIPTTLVFANTSSANATRFQWDFGDPASGTNNTSSIKNPSHTYTKPGEYIITLTATDEINQVSAFKKDTVKLNHRTFATQLRQGVGLAVLPALDSGYLISSSVGWIKTDQAGKEQWVYTPNVTGFENPHAIQHSNGDYYLAYIHKASNGGKKVRVARLNNKGNFIKDQVFNGAEQLDDYLGDIIFNQNKELLLYGVFFRSETSSGKFEAKLLQFDLSLVSSAKTLVNVPDIIPIYGVQILQASDGNYVGIQKSTFISSPTYSLFSLSSSLSTRYNWLAPFNDINALNDIVQLPSGDLFVAAFKKSNLPSISRHILGSGALQNSKDFNYSGSSFTGLIVSSDNQLIACGKGELFLTKINAIDLKEIWRKPSSVFSNSEANGLAKTSDGGIIITGSIKVGPNNQVYLIKTDENGEL